MQVNRDALEILLQTGGQMLGQSVFDVKMIVPDIFWPPDEAPTSNKDLLKTDYDKLVEQLEASVRKSLTGCEDKKVGLTLSGGVDSSLALFLIKRVFPEIDLVAYHTDYQTPERSELQFARITADFVGVPLRAVAASASAQAPFVEETVIKHKLIDQNATCAYMAFKTMAEDSVDIAVNGLGLDELFAGYTIHRRYYERSAFHYLPFSEFLQSSKYYREACRRWGSDKAWLLSDIAPRLSTTYVKESNVDFNQIFSSIQKKYLWNTIHNWILHAMINSFANNISVMARLNGLDVIYPYMEHNLMKLCLSYSPSARWNKAPIRKIMRETYGFPSEIPARGEKWDKLGWGSMPVTYFDSKEYMSIIKPNLETAKDWFTPDGVKELKDISQARSVRSLHMALFLKILESG
jgi:asparagine synthetase B (glutamine-hydrolysing)